eukprot:TRINITY_DN73357_c0_g1_i1.p1 TRINITY_DN73357_c0_g1~~TRINITY_DN73357_c0_g1_i1.p1  ORF type:complete len:203 (-),score=23.59 TRINITY_DN73357_c0_g1_i1:104-712(-)
MPVGWEISEKLTGEWTASLWSSPCKAPLTFLYSACCPCCMAAQQRNEILELTGEPYVCCGGLFPCGPFGQPQSPSCVWVEACCCTSLAIGGNRFYVQTRFNKMNTACDDCILWTTCLLTWCVCLLQMVMDVPGEITNCVDCLNMTVSGCMQTQQAIEVSTVKAQGYQPPPPQVAAMLTPVQQGLLQQGSKPAQHGMKFGMGV